MLLGGRKQRRSGTVRLQRDGAGDYTGAAETAPEILQSLIAGLAPFAGWETDDGLIVDGDDRGIEVCVFPGEGCDPGHRAANCDLGHKRESRCMHLVNENSSQKEGLTW
jgi:hypothetical protein